MKLAVIAVAISAISPSAEAFAPTSAFNGARVAGATTTRASTSAVEMSAASDNFKKAATGALAIFAGLSLFTAPPSEAITRDSLDSLSYKQVKGTGLANRCPEVEGEDTINVSGGSKIVDMCIEPKNFQVLSKVARGGNMVPAMIDTKLMTRETYTLYGIEGDFGNKDGKLTFTEKDGIDYAATTIQSNYERIPFLFTVKDLVAKASSGGNQVKPGFQMGGSFRTPSYRTGLFLDPKGRGGSTGYDMAVALPGLQSGVEGDAELFKENNKVFEVSDGNIEFEVNNVDKEAGEIGGVFVSKQKGDTDMGSKVPKDILVKGVFYARIQ
eukprot:TRINITY_DN20604_c0_g1_i1.p2 TRINITY_DN20604_c0_g1~~TRINITY_DN20604_c0_g1_i1.p2  ORF type:complete len:326 (+),score=54.80 TRINITY_DN20604_c0_g1_i1:96-1073(+)